MSPIASLTASIQLPSIAPERRDSPLYGACANGQYWLLNSIAREQFDLNAGTNEASLDRESLNRQDTVLHSQSSAFTSSVP